MNLLNELIGLSVINENFDVIPLSDGSYTLKPKGEAKRKNDEYVQGRADAIMLDSVRKYTTNLDNAWKSND